MHLTHIRRWGRRAIVEYLAENGKKKSSSLTGASLSTSHEVTPIGDNGDGILLHWGGPGVLSKLFREKDNRLR